jgi:uncharacterized GH25 family protein
MSAIRISGLIAWLVLAGAAASASAHDFWIEPSTFWPRVGERVNVGLRVGDHFKGLPVARSPERIVKFVSLGPGGEKPIVGREGADPAGLARFTEPGWYVLGYRSNHAFTEMEGAKFEEYLREKGLEKVVALRKERGLSGERAREAYSRCSKSLVHVGEASGEAQDRRIGFTLEIVAESDPDEKADGSQRSFRVLFDGEPLEGALVTAARRDAANETMEARTGADGRVKLSLDEAGVWLVASVHMIEAPQGVDAEWESFWASLTWELSAVER